MKLIFCFFPQLGSFLLLYTFFSLLVQNFSITVQFDISLLAVVAFLTLAVLLFSAHWMPVVHLSICDSQLCL